MLVTDTIKIKQVAVFGSGGYLGAVLFGFLQRASSIYGTGLAAPRAMGASSITLSELNRVLGREFKLAFAGEDSCRLNDMADVEHIAARLKNMNAAVLGTMYQLETRAVTFGTYEKSPNDKTLEYFFDYRYAAVPAPENEDFNQHMQLFQNTIQACQIANLQHLVIVETPQTSTDIKTACLNILQSCGIPFTYLQTGTQEWTRTNPYTFEFGIQCPDLNIAVSPMEKYNSQPAATSSTIAREDIAAIVVQSLMSLDWNTNWMLDITTPLEGTKIDVGGSTINKKKLKSDNQWCVGSSVLADKLSL